MKNNYHNKIIIVFVFIVLCLFYMNLKPYIGISLTTNEGDYFIAEVHELGWGATNDVRVGDQVLYINASPPSQHFTVENQLRIEQAETITVVRETGPVVYTINNSQVPTKQYIYYLVFPLAYFIFVLTVIKLLYRSKSNKQSTNMLILFLMTLCISYISASLSVKLDKIGGLVLISTFLIVPVLFLHFVYYYLLDHKKEWINKNLFSFLYFLSSLAFLLVSISFLGIIDGINYKTLALIFFSIFVMVIIVTLIKCYRVSRIDMLNEQMKWFLYAFLFSVFPFIFLYVVPYLLFGEVIVSGELTILFIFFMPAIIFYLLLVNKLFSVRLYVNKLTYYTAIVIIPTIVFTAIIKIAFVGDYTLISLIRTFLLIYLLMLAFLFFKNYLDRSLRTVLFVEKEFYQRSIYRFSEAVKREKGINGVVRCIQRELSDVLQLKSFDYVKVFKNGVIQGMEDIPFVHKVAVGSLSIGKIVQDKEHFLLVIGEQENYYYCVVVESLRITPFSKEQLDWLEVLAYYTSISLENMSKIEDLVNQLQEFQKPQLAEGNPNWLNQLIFSWSEKERKQLATDIHDSILQDLITLKRKVEDVKQVTDSEQSDLEARIVDIEEDILDLMSSTRETCHELAPPFLEEMGLEHGLKQLQLKFNLRYNSHLVVKAELENKVLPSYYVLTIYRVVQELLNNASKHSNATKISILVAINDGQLELHYEDNGIGVDVTKMLEDQNKIGLRGIESRVHAYDGNIKITSEAGKGMKVLIRLSL